MIYKVKDIKIVMSFSSFFCYLLYSNQEYQVLLTKKTEVNNKIALIITENKKIHASPDYSSKIRFKILRNRLAFFLRDETIHHFTFDVRVN